MTDAKYLRSAQDKRDFPTGGLCELAFAGRSNVGKSSLINALVGKHNLVRTSKTPGQTRKLNFFLIDERVIFVDLPGYGFAKVPPEMKRSWGPMVEGYVKGRKELAGAVLVVDVRRGLAESDMVMMSFLRSHQVPIIIGATKADKLPRGQLLQEARRVRAEVGVDVPVIICSAHNNMGKNELWKELKTLIESWRRS
jgi:GTP-binding protein